MHRIRLILFVVSCLLVSACDAQDETSAAFTQSEAWLQECHRLLNASGVAKTANAGGFRVEFTETGRGTTYYRDNPQKDYGEYVKYLLHAMGKFEMTCYSDDQGQFEYAVIDDSAYDRIYGRRYLHRDGTLSRNPPK